jgi:hypothetical protein
MTKHTHNIEQNTTPQDTDWPKLNNHKPDKLTDPPASATLETSTRVVVLRNSYLALAAATS